MHVGQCVHQDSVVLGGFTREDSEVLWSHTRTGCAVQLKRVDAQQNNTNESECPHKYTEYLEQDEQQD